MRLSATLAGVIPIGLYALALVPLAAAASTTAPTDELRIDTTRSVACTRKTHNGDKISVHYNGTLASDGTEFDSSMRGGVPFTFELGANYVIKGWDLGLLDMCIGERRTLTIPARLGYGRSGSGPIPGDATLVFETELMGIAGVEIEEVAVVPAEKENGKGKELADGEGHLSVAAPDLRPGGYTVISAPKATPTAESITTTAAAAAAKATATAASAVSPMESDDNDNECHLLGPYALFVQGALGLLALTALVVKRWREHPRRPVKIWFFDVSKQVFGSALLHLANVLMSMLSSGSFDVATATTTTAGEEEDQPNPCSFYLLNIFIDTTIGIPILVLLLRILHALFLRTALANPPESIRSGNYSPQSSPSSPPRWTWWLKQSLIYFLGLFGMKLCVFFLFQLLPWIAWVGDWALRWTEGNEALQITFVMFVFPLVMNALQYWIIDGFIKDRGEGQERGGEGYGRVREEEEGEAEGLVEGDEEWLERHRRERRERRGEGEEDEEESEDELEEANPTPFPVRRSSSSGRVKGAGKAKSREYDPGRDGES